MAGYLTPRGLQPDIVTPVGHDLAWMPYDLGKHVGATLGGSVRNRKELDAWLAVPRTDGWAVMARALRDGLTPPLTPETIAYLYRHSVEDAA